MIEITDEMVDSAARVFTIKPTEATYVAARMMLKAALEAYEQSKPKPEPFGYFRLDESFNWTDCEDRKSTRLNSSHH